MASKRLPLSCENCRQRKIRCINSGYNAPCDTCSRRGYASSCRFRRQDRLDAPSLNPENTSTLEDLLRQNIALTTALLRQRNETNLPSPSNSSPAESRQTVGDRTPSSQEPAPGQHSGRLIVSPTNHVRFVPSNDLGDSDLLDAMVHDSTPSFPTGFPFFEQPGANAVSDELLDMLPPLPQLEELKATFFRVFSPLFHILHDPTFHSKYDVFKMNPKGAPLPFVALLFVMLSLSVTALDDDDPLLVHLGRDPLPGANIRSLSAKYRGAAMRCLVADNFMFRHNLCTLQALVLLIYAINHAQGPAWSLLGTTLHIAVAIGCAVDPARLNVDPIEAEERRRCWAALRMLYTIQNTCLGNLMPFRIDANVDLPADVEDDDILRVDREPTDASARDTPPTKMTYILYKVRLYNLAFDVCQLTSHDRSKTEALDARVACEEQRLIHRFSTPLEELPSYHQAHYYIISSYTNHLALLLHRPWLSTTGPPTHPHQDQSALRCEQCATTNLTNFSKICTDPLFRSYRWYVNGLGSFLAFFSITTLLILHGNGQLNATTKLETTELILRCAELLSINAARSPVAAKATRILDRIIPHVHVNPSPLPPPPPPTMPSQQHHEAAPAPAAAPAMLPIGEGGDFIFDSFPELENMYYDLPSEQWLSPSGFPWIVS
ncbi:Zn(II)2Cys6 transcription factor [Aspergillus lucknowensis]|uniref:Fungal-specific transcription factor domain-containing protein n=1 Tax=Aspergillus lucknowensis TaxID=176173 RepID=A0ABR4LN63_9EURO